MITVLAPAYNEAPVIEKLVRAVMGALKGSFEFELLIVDDGSSDETPYILKRLQREYPNLVVVRHSENRGLGAGLMTGFRSARGNIIVTMDANLSHDPKLIPEIVATLENSVDIVIASRFVKGGGMEGVPLWRNLISRAGNMVLGVFLRMGVRDHTSGFRGYRAKLVKEIRNVSKGFEAQLEILLALNSTRVPVVKEVPLMLKNRGAGESKMRYFQLVPRYLRAIYLLVH